MSLADDIDAQLRREKHDAALLNLIDAAKPFLVDDTIVMNDLGIGEVYQCTHCGSHAEEARYIDHHVGCVGETLRKAIKAAEKVL